MPEEYKECITDCDDGDECVAFEVIEDNNETPHVTHVYVTKSGDIFHAYRSLELEYPSPGGDMGIIVIIDAINYPEKGDRSMITIDKNNIEFTQQYFDEDHWNMLCGAAHYNRSEQLSRYEHPEEMYS